MNKQLLLVGIATLLICVGLSGCSEQGIHTIKLNEGSYNFVNITEEQMQNFPHLKEAILTNKSIELAYNSVEMSELRGILEYFDTYIINYQNEYYEIQIYFAD